MSVVKAELKLYSPLNNPADFTNSLGGGIDVADEVTGGSVGELILKEEANAGGGADVLRYAKAFYKNTNAADDLSDAKCWQGNALLNAPAQAVIQAESDSGSDDDTKQLRMVYESAGVWEDEKIDMDGVGTVQSTSQVDSGTKVYIEILTKGTGALTVAAGTISITIGSAVGVMPSGASSAHALTDLALEGALGDAETTADRTTAPGVVVFSRANDYDSTGIAVANAGTLTHATAQGIWIRQTLPDGLPVDTTKLEVAMDIKGDGN